MKTDRIKALINKYYEGQTTEYEEQELREFVEDLDLPEEFLVDKEIFKMYEAMAKDTGTEKSFDLAKAEMKLIDNSNRKIIHQIRMNWLSGIAAGFAFLLVGLTIGLLINRQNIDNNQISAMRNDLQEMKEMVALNNLKNESASDRIMAAYQVKQLDKADNELLDALINTLTMDNNVNVRMAAADALYKFGDNDKVRNAFINSLSIEKDPNLEIKLIDMLVNLREKRALPALQNVMNNDEKLDVVRQRAAQGMSKLI